MTVVMSHFRKLLPELEENRTNPQDIARIFLKYVSKDRHMGIHPNGR